MNTEMNLARKFLSMQFSAHRFRSSLININSRAYQPKFQQKIMRSNFGKQKKNVLLFTRSVIQVLIYRDFISNHIQTMKTILLLSLFIIVSFSAYNQVLGEKLCRLAVASYCKKAEVQKWACTPCKNSPLVMNNVKTFENSSMDTLGFIGTSAELNAIVLVFRGTLPWDLKNWISDINFVAISYPLCNNNCKVHRGFYFAWTDIQKNVLDTVASYRQKYSFPNIVVTGHSLGAAIATHAVAHLLANKIPVTDFYNYGSPRVGDPKFTVWFNEVYGGANHFKARVTHGRDPVPHLPLQDWGFLHVNTQIFYKGDVKSGFTVCKDTTGQDKTCSDKNKLDVDVLDHVTYYDIDFSGIILACQK